MILLLDIGNTRIKWGFLQYDRYCPGSAIAYRAHGLMPLWQAWADIVPTRVVAANVAGAVVATVLAEGVAQRWGLAVEYPRAVQAACGITNGYREPEQLGVDRWFAMIGAYHLAGDVTCVVDCGTALTIDALGAGGQHLGGWILPGRQTMQQAVTGATAGVRLEEDFKKAMGHPAFGRDTAAALVHGIDAAMLGSVLQATVLLQERTRRMPVCVLTGGDAPSLLPLLPTGCHHQPDLVLRGLATWVGSEGA